MNNKKIRNKILSVLLVLCVLFVPLFSGSVLAEPLAKKQIYFNNLTPEDSNKFTSKVLHVQKVKELKNNYSFDYSKMFVKQLSDKQSHNQLNMVYIPIKDNTGYNYSKYHVFLDKDSNYLDSLLFTFTKKEGNIYNFIAQTDKSKIDADITEDGKVVKVYTNDAEGICQDLNSLLQKSNIENNTNKLISDLLSIKLAFADCSYSCVEDCLSSLGVPQWVLTGMSLFCRNNVCYFIIVLGWLSQGVYCLTDCGCYDDYEIIIL